MNKLKTLLLAATALVLTGCGTTPTPTTPLDVNFYSPESVESTKVGVYMSLPGIDTHLPGASCLLCMAAASVANSDLTKHIKTLSPEELKDLDDSLVSKLNEKGMQAHIVKSMPNEKYMTKFKSESPMFAKVDYRSFKDSLGIDKLIIVKINQLGAYRPYSGYFPTADPMGTVTGVAYMVDLNTNRYEMYVPITFNIAATGEWDEPPYFPGVTSSYFQAIEMAKGQVINLF